MRQKSDVKQGRAEEDFEDVFVSHRDVLMRYAVRRVALDDAADVVAETFAVALRRWSTGAPPRDPLPWRYAVAHNVIRNHRRGVGRSSVGLPEAWTPALEYAVDDRLALLTALSLLSPTDREVLMLAAWEGLDSRELAIVLGCSRVAARVRLSRARQRLTTAIDPEAARTEGIPL